MSTLTTDRTQTQREADLVGLWAGFYLAAVKDYGHTWNAWRATARSHEAHDVDRARMLAREMQQHRERIERAERLIESAGGKINPWAPEGEGRIYNVDRQIIARF